MERMPFTVCCCTEANARARDNGRKEEEMRDDTGETARERERERNRERKEDLKSMPDECIGYKRSSRSRSRSGGGWRGQKRADV